MSNAPKKTKPQAPSMPIPEVIEKVRIIYNKDNCHAIPTESAADALGYTNARSGSAITTLASIKMFGLLNSPQPGHLAVDQSFVDYEYSPDENQKQKIVLEWLHTPKIYAELLQRFENHMPSEATLKYELIKIGFTGKGLQKFMKSFISSVQFSKYYELQKSQEFEEHEVHSTFNQSKDNFSPVQVTNTKISEVMTGSDRIPIRLSGGRKAWLEIPMPFYEKDKKVINDQVELIITDEEEND